MNNLLASSAYFGILCSIAVYLFGMWLQKRFHKWFLNPMLVTLVVLISFLVIFRIDLDAFSASASHLEYLLTPTTVCFAIPLYRQLQRLKEHPVAILCGVAAGAFAAMLSILLMSILFRLDHATYVTVLPKSITTALGVSVAGELGGYPSITVVMISITGILGNITAPAMLKLFRITDPVAKGIAIGTASHAMGTARARELGETEGAMSSLAIVICGLITVIGASFFAMLH